MSWVSDLSSGAVGGLVSSVGGLAKDLRVAFTGELPVEKRAELEQKVLELENQAMLAQTEINKIEASSEKLFVSAWRPFLGWCCGAAFVYACIIEPIVRFIAQVCVGYGGPFPLIDTNLTMQVLIGMLGLGTMRSYDKKQEPSPKGKE